MKKLLFCVMALVCPAMAQSFVPITASNITDASGTPLASGQFQAIPTDGNGHLVAFKLPGYGVGLTTPVTCNIANGVITGNAAGGVCQLADTSKTNPQNLCFQVSIVDNLTGNTVRPVDQCYQPTNALANGDFDTFIPNVAAIPVETLTGGNTLTTGTTSGTVAAGNDPRIVNSIQSMTYSTALYSFGDSITCGYVSVGHSGPYTVGEDCHTSSAYPSLMSLYLGSVLNNLSIPGDQACDLWPRQIGINSVSPSLAIPFIGTEMIGTNDANSKGVGSYEAVFNTCQQASLAWLGTPVESKTLPSSATIVSGWTVGGGGAVGAYIISSTAGSTVTFPIQTYGAPIYAWYTINDAVAPSSSSGTFSYAIDGGTATQVKTQSVPAMATANGTSNSVALLRVPVAAGAHTVSFVNVSGTTAILGVGTAPTNQYATHPVVVVSDPPIVPSVNAASAQQYGTDVQNNVALLKGDGLDLRFMSNHAYMLGASAELQSDGTHPTALGAQHYSQAFLQAMKAIPLPATAASTSHVVSGNDTLLATDTTVYANCSAACTFTLPARPTGPAVSIMATGSDVSIASPATLNGLPNPFTIRKGYAYTFVPFNSAAWTPISKTQNSIGIPTLEGIATHYTGGLYTAVAKPVLDSKFSVSATASTGAVAGDIVNIFFGAPMEWAVGSTTIPNCTVTPVTAAAVAAGAYVSASASDLDLFIANAPTVGSLMVWDVSCGVN